MTHFPVKLGRQNGIHVTVRPRSTLDPDSARLDLDAHADIARLFPFDQS
jgi:hypothetical protein